MKDGTLWTKLSRFKSIRNKTLRMNILIFWSQTWFYFIFSDKVYYSWLTPRKLLSQTYFIVKNIYCIVSGKIFFSSYFPKSLLISFCQIERYVRWIDMAGIFTYLPSMVVYLLHSIQAQIFIHMQHLIFTFKKFPSYSTNIYSHSTNNFFHNIRPVNSLD